MKRFERQQLIIFALAVVIVAGFIGFRYYPLARSAKAAEYTATGQLTMIAQTNENIRQLPELRRDIDELCRATGNYDKKIPQERQFADLWRQIAEVMNKHNLQNQLVQPGAEIKGEKVNCIPISIKCEGSFKQIFELLQSLQGLQRLIRIESLNLANDNDFTGSIKMQADAKVYYQAYESGNI